jgi:hypothetical protein
MCEEVLFGNFKTHSEIAISLRNLNTEYSNDITFDQKDYEKFQIEDYLEYIRFLNFLFHQYWDIVRNDPLNTKKQIEISLRIYRELAEGLEHNYKVFCKSSPNVPYFASQTHNGKLSDLMKMCEDGMRNPTISINVAIKILEINSMYQRDFQFDPTNYPLNQRSHIQELLTIFENYWNLVDSGESITAQLQMAYRFYKKLDLIQAMSPSTFSSPQTMQE